MEREVGGGIGMGNKCKPMAVSFQCMTKSTTNKKTKKKQKKTPIPSKTVMKLEHGLRTSLLKTTGLYIADGLCVRHSKVAYSPLALRGTLN